MTHLQIWLQNHNRRLTQASIDEALMEYITHIEAKIADLQAENELLKQVEANLAELHNVALAENEALRARLAEIESQEPVAFAYYSDKYKKPMLEQTENARGYEGEWKIVPLFAAPVVSPDVAALKDEISELKSHNKLIMDMYVQYSDENQSLKTELVNWKSRCEHRVADIQLQAKRVVDLEATMRSLNAELEAARKDAERYRWLRDKSMHGRPEDPAPTDGVGYVYSEHLDAAIDAAIEQAKRLVCKTCNGEGA